MRRSNFSSGCCASVIYRGEVIANSEAQVNNYRNAPQDKRPKMLGYFVGQIMKASKGQANPKMINEILINKLNDLL